MTEPPNALQASSLISFYTNIAVIIKNIAGIYNAAATTASISAECSAIDEALKNIQVLLSQPHALSSQVISQTQLENTLKFVYNGCNTTISRLEDEVRKCTSNMPSMGGRAYDWNSTQLCDEVLIKVLLRQIQRQLTDASLLILAARRNSTTEILKLLKNDTFACNTAETKKDQADIPTSSHPGGYNQVIQEHFNMAGKNRYNRGAESISQVSMYSELSGSFNPPSPISSVPPLPDKAKKHPRAQMGSIFFKLFKSNTELHRAAKKGDLKKIKALVDLGVDINYEGSSGCTALHLATDAGHEAMVRLLLSNGADPAVKSSEGRTPLHSAARIGNPAVIRLLVEKSVDVHARDPSGSTALHIAAYNGQESAVQILLDKNAWIEVRGASGFTALHVAAFNGQSAVVRLLVEMGADLEAKSDNGRTALQLAAERGHEAVVRHLLMNGANIMVKDNLGRTALQGAVSNQHGVVAQLLLDKAVVTDDSSNRSIYSGSISGPSYDLRGGQSPFKTPVSPATMVSPCSQQGYNTPIYEMPGGSWTAVELPGGEVDERVKDHAVTTQRMKSPSYWKRVEDT